MSFLGEIKRRKVFQVAAVYAVVAWLIVQIVSVIETPLRLPDWFDTATIVLLVIGFPITLIMSWGFNLTPEGVVREDGGTEVASTSGFRIEYILFGVIAIALMWLVYRVEFDEPQLVVETRAIDEQAVEDTSAEAPSDVLPNSIAVLPFENLSPDPDNAYFAAGIHEDTIDQLAKIGNLVVRPRASVLQFADERPSIAEIANALDASYILDGSVRYGGGRVRITAQLIDGRRDRQTWSNSFDRELTDVFAIQAEIAREIAAAMRVELLVDENARIDSKPTESEEAYKHYLRALSLPNIVVVPEYRDAYIQSMQQAVAADSEFAEAYAMLAWGQYQVRDTENALKNARRAIELNPTSGRAYNVLGLVYDNYHDSQGEGREANRLAAELSPNNATIVMEHAYRLAMRDLDFETAIRVGERALLIEPDRGASVIRFINILLRAGEIDRAQNLIDAALLQHSGNYILHYTAALADYFQGQNDASIEHLDNAMLTMSPGARARLGEIGNLYGLQGETERGREVYERYLKVLADPERRAWRPIGWASLGTRDQALALDEWSRTINGYLDERKPVAPFRVGGFRDNWLNDPMLEEPEFLKLRRRLGYEG
jgi:TolB-like protein/Tfp pilus assembly protein PilF